MFFMLAAEPPSGNTHFLSALIGAGASIVVFVLTAYNQRRNSGKKELQDYILTLQFAQDEMTFYAGKLEQIFSEIDLIRVKIPLRPAEIIIPSYDVLPNFLERSKIALSGFARNRQIIQGIGNCHFELCHVRERLTQTKSMLSACLGTPAMQMGSTIRAINDNLHGFQSLTQSTKVLFGKCSAQIDIEVANAKAELENYDFAHPPFSP